jgi:GT2 family glycosyltransferase
MSNPSPPPVSPLVKPVVLRDAAGALVASLKVDAARLNGRHIEVVGWATESCRVQLWHDARQLPTKSSAQKRPDVARALKLVEPAGGLGFSLSARNPQRDNRQVQLRVVVSTGKGEQVLVYELPLVGEGVGASPFLDPFTGVAGEIEEAWWCAATGDVVLAGWLVAGRRAEVWAQTDSGERLELEGAYRYHRPDVWESHSGAMGAAASNAGLLLRLHPGGPCERICLHTSAPEQPPRSFAEAVLDPLEIDPVQAARRLFGVQSPASEFVQRVALVDAPVLDALIAHSRSEWPAMELRHRVFGRRAAAPKVSLVIPLYGRIDFVEHQLMAFAGDGWLQANAQLVYVLDDPSLLESLTQQAPEWFELYGVAFEWVYGGLNRGYSGANNLGASVARAEQLLFMNSDVFPLAPGWLQTFTQCLLDNPAVGMLGARLVYPDGGLQHAGMAFERREALGIWVNHHPLMGCARGIDTRRGLSQVQAVTGACMLMPKAVFDQVGGWDTSYLVGDFEDSDLGFKVRAAGFQVAYLPEVELTHLERQSFRLLGQGSFRQRVVIFNAARHQDRWAAQLQALAQEVSA